jgi:hypothetical protein
MSLLATRGYKSENSTPSRTKVNTQAGTTTPVQVQGAVNDVPASIRFLQSCSLGPFGAVDRSTLGVCAITFNTHSIQPVFFYFLILGNERTSSKDGTTEYDIETGSLGISSISMFSVGFKI